MLKALCAGGFLLLACILAGSHALPSGAPAAACADMHPRSAHLLSGRQPNPSGDYVINITAFSDGVGHSYIPGATYRISFVPLNGHTFRGFFIQGRRSADNGQVGAFVDPQSTQLQGFESTQLSLCTEPEIGVTHNNAARTDFNTPFFFDWVAPPAGTGQVRFAYTTVRVLNVYWVMEASGAIDERIISPTTTTTTGTSTGTSTITTDTSTGTSTISTTGTSTITTGTSTGTSTITTTDTTIGTSTGTSTITTGTSTGTSTITTTDTTGTSTGTSTITTSTSTGTSTITTTDTTTGTSTGTSTTITPTSTSTSTTTTSTSITPTSSSTPTSSPSPSPSPSPTAPPPHILVEFERQFYSVIEGHYFEVCVIVRGEVTFEIILNIHARSKFLRLYERLIIEVGVEIERRLCVSFHIFDDFYFNPLERELELEIEPFEPYPGLYFGTIYPAWLFLVDPAIIEVGFVQDEYEVAENAGSVHVCIELFSHIYLGLPVVLRVESDGGDAVAGVDYEPINEIVALPSGGVQGVQICFYITILDDDIFELPEIFYIHIIQFDHRVIVTRKYVTIRIIDNDDIHFVFRDNTPLVNLDTLHLSFYASPPPVSATCAVTRSNEGSQNCTNGEAWFILRQSVRPHDIVVNATFPNGEIRILDDRRVRSETSDVCWAHLINDGVTVDGNNATVEFQGTGPAVNDPPRIQQFECTLNDVNIRGTCMSPLTVRDLDPGCYWISIRPVDGNCRRRIRNTVHFCIE